MNKQSSNWIWFLGRLRTHFLAGLLVVVPIAASILILVWVFRTIDDILQPIIKGFFGHTITGLGFGITIMLIFIVGSLTGNYIGRRLIQFGDSILKKVPLFRQLYTGAKQVMEGLAGTGAITKAAFREVVLVEFPTTGMSTIAFITNEFTDEKGTILYAIYVPTTPIPSSGFSGIISADKITHTKLTVDEALRMVISGIMIAPSSLKLMF
jgi:uncharacterized membrane protein